MTEAKALHAQGTTIKIGDGAAPEVFNSIGEVKNISEIGGTRSVLDATTLTSTVKEKVMGLADYGQVPLELQYDPTDTTGQDALRSALSSKTKKNFKIEIPGYATPLTFSAYVMSFKINGIAVDGIVNASATLELTTEVTGW